MSKKMLIDATHAEETRVVVVDGNKVEEFDFETVNKRQLAGNIYLAKVTRVEPSLQAAFVDYGGNRHGFLAFAEIHPDYYQIPVADRKALLEEERAFNKAQDEEENRRSRPRRGAKPAAKAEKAETGDEVKTGEISAMDVVDLGEDDHSAETAAETGVEISAEVEAPATDEPAQAETNGDSGDHPYHAIDHASDTDDEIESIAEEDVAEEIAVPRRPRARRYKIQEVIKVRQIMLVQVVKEERGNKGAALTTYLSLAGRYCVLMPNTARGGGISRKITQAADRKKLKEIAQEIKVPEGAGLIIRTAGAKRTKPEIKRDYEYLMRLWEQIRELTLKSIAPAPIYEEGNLIKRSIRDLYSKEIEEVLVEGEAGYRTAKDFMRMIMPSHARQVQRYADPTPLFARYQVEGYLAGMFNPVVQLKSGGYIVIGVTEALVAIDVNSGRATKEGSIEDTALKTNLEAAEEIARQLRLRDLAGLIVIDFIDMEERRNNAAVEKRLKDKLKTDRARIQVGRISGFGLMEMSRQRLRPGMLESTTQPCPHCHGTGLIRSDDSMALQVLRALEEEGTRKRSKEVLLKAPIGIVNFLFNQKREHIALIEARYGMSVRIEADPALVSPDYAIEKFKTATRVVPENSPVISGHAGLMGAPVDEPEEDILDEEIVEEAEDEAVEATTPAAAETADGAGGSRKRRRRRRRRKPGSGNGEEASANALDGAEDDEEDGEDEEEAAEAAETSAAPDQPAEVTEAAPQAEVAPEAPVKRTSSRSRKPAAAKAAEAEAAPAEAATESPVEEAAEAGPKRRTRTRAAKPKAAEAVADEAVSGEAGAEAPADAGAEPAKPKATRRRAKPKAAQAEVADSPEPAPEQAVEAPAPVEEAPAPSAVAEAEVPAAAEVPVAVEAFPADPVMTEPTPTEALLPDPDDKPVVDQTAPEEASAEPPVEDGPPKPRKKGWWSLGR